MKNNRTGDNGYAPGARNIEGAAGESGVQSFLERQQELARDHILTFRYETEAEYKDLDTLIAQIITNTGEELMRLAEGERVDEKTGILLVNSLGEAGELGKSIGINQAIDALKKHIASVTGVE